MALGKEFLFLLKRINYVNHKISNKINKFIQNIEYSYSTVTLSKDESALIKKNAVFQNCHKGQRCFILATGPSIKTQDLKPLKGEICIAASNFYLHPDYSYIKPRYYCMAAYHPPITEDAYQNLMGELDKNTKDEKIFFSLSDRVRYKKDGCFTNKEVHFLNFGGSLGSIIDRGIDLTRAVPGPSSVSIMALEIAMYMGFSEIYLLGCDHDWILHMYESRHFYNEEQSVWHKHQIDEWKYDSFLIQARQNVCLWEQYEQIKSIAEKQHTQIFNATNGGLLDVFPKKRFETLFNCEYYPS